MAIRLRNLDQNRDKKIGFRESLVGQLVGPKIDEAQDRLQERLRSLVTGSGQDIDTINGQPARIIEGRGTPPPMLSSPPAPALAAMPTMTPTPPPVMPTVKPYVNTATPRPAVTPTPYIASPSPK